MPSYFDIYVITNERNRQTVARFLEHFAPLRSETADDYPYPQYSDVPEIVYQDIEQVLNRCCNHANVDYRLYWKAKGNAKPEHAMVFFLADGHVIFGLSTDDSYPQYAAELLQDLKRFLGSELGYIGHEASPDVDNLLEFQQEITRNQW